MIRKSLGFVAATMLLSACVTERVIVVQPQGGAGGTLQVAGNGGAQNVGDENGEWGIRGPDAEEYARVVQKVAGMVSDGTVASGARRRGLNVMNVMWEDTGRDIGSSVGPNISDLTLQVRYKDTSGNHTS